MAFEANATGSVCSARKLKRGLVRLLADDIRLAGLFIDFLTDRIFYPGLVSRFFECLDLVTNLVPLVFDDRVEVPVGPDDIHSPAHTILLDGSIVLWPHRYIAGPAMEAGAVFGLHGPEAIRNALNGWHLGIVGLRQTCRTGVAAPRAA
jgi:hypothetical protein